MDQAQCEGKSTLSIIWFFWTGLKCLASFVYLCSGDASLLLLNSRKEFQKGISWRYVFFPIGQTWSMKSFFLLFFNITYADLSRPDSKPADDKGEILESYFKEFDWWVDELQASRESGYKHTSKRWNWGRYSTDVWPRDREEEKR